MPEIREATERPHAAISPAQRVQVVTCIFSACDDPGGPYPLGATSNTLRDLARRLTEPGPPLVSTADVAAVLEVVALLEQLRDAEELVHPWGVVRRQNGRFWIMLSAGDELSFEKSWQAASAFYEDHLRQRGLVQ